MHATLAVEDGLDSLVVKWLMVYGLCVGVGVR